MKHDIHLILEYVRDINKKPQCLLGTSKALRDDADLKMRASSFGSVVVWPGDEGSIDENSVKANYGLIKHVPPAYRLWNDVLLVPTLKWIMIAVAECWEASLLWACAYEMIVFQLFMCQYVLMLYVPHMFMYPLRTACP